MMSDNNPLDQIIWDWGVRCFGIEHMTNVPIRSLRAAEEAVEAAQACGVDRETMHKLVDTVYSRPHGKLTQEIGGMLVTSRVLAMSYAIYSPNTLRTPDSFYLEEVRRVLSKTPLEFARRNQEKLDLGLDANDKAK